jgi:hypothetical protein
VTTHIVLMLLDLLLEALPASTQAHAMIATRLDKALCMIIANVALNVFTNYVNKIAQTEIDFPRVLSGELT